MFVIYLLRHRETSKTYVGATSNLRERMLARFVRGPERETFGNPADWSLDVAALAGSRKEATYLEGFFADQVPPELRMSKSAYAGIGLRSPLHSVPTETPYAEHVSLDELLRRDAGTKIADAALKIADELRKLAGDGVARITVRALKKAAVLTGLPPTTWQLARDEALSMTGWAVEGQSLVRNVPQFIDETLAA